MPTGEDYEAIVQRNRAANRAQLAALGLPLPIPPTKSATLSIAFKKSKSNGNHQPPLRKRKISEDKPEVERRRSSRLTEKTFDLSKLENISDPGFSDDDPPRQLRKKGQPNSNISKLEDFDSAANEDDFCRRTVSGRNVASYNPNASIKAVDPAYGAIQDVPVGTQFPERRLAALANIHRPWVSGIHGHPVDGCYSIALSGGYEDDIDEGYRFLFTGSGGRELKKKNLRTAPQSCDQPLNNNNLSLIKSYELGKPVRVVRGFKGKNQWSPVSGYRYDGLYMVERWWQEEGKSGFKVYRYAFTRIEGQPPLVLGAQGF